MSNPTNEPPARATHPPVNAAARVITLVDEMLETVIGLGR